MKQAGTIPCIVGAGLSIALFGAIAATPLPAATPAIAAQNPRPAIELVRTAAANECAAANDAAAKHMFRSRKQTLQGSQTRLYVETREAMAGLTIAYNDQPLTPQQMQAEQSRLAGLVGDPEQLRHKHSQEQETEERTLRILKALPDAFLYEYDNAGNDGKDQGPWVRLKFRPNPEYHPPSRVEQILTGMQGFLVIDRTAGRIATIDGTLFRQVGFGWGILGYLDKGGHFLVEQREAGDGTWQISRMSLSLNGKILLFKNVVIQSDEVFSDFRVVPAGTTFAQGVAMLKAQDLAQVRTDGVRTDGSSH